MKVEVTLQFDVPDGSDNDEVSSILRERIKDFDYYNELVSWIFITSPDKSIVFKDAKLEHLERAISAFRELLVPDSCDRSIEADNLLALHHRQARETYYKDN